jgi:ketosteroid isomerase-like protein
MKRNLALAAIVITSSSFISCTAEQKEANSNRQTGNITFTSAQSTGSAEQEVAQMERDWSAAMSRQDIATIEQMMAEDIVTNGPDGIKNKAERLEEIKKEFEPNKKNGVVKVTENLDYVKAAAYGDVIISYGHFHWKDENSNKVETGKSTFTDVAVKRNGRWQFVSMSTINVTPQDQSSQAFPTDEKK